jgi:hypothetical protein
MDATPARYREMARRASEKAQSAPDTSIRDEYLKIARAYESLADHAERLKKSTPPASGSDKPPRRYDSN